MRLWCYPGFGLTLECDFPLLDGLGAAQTASGHVLRARLGDYDALSRTPDNYRLVWETRFEGAAYRMLRGPEATHRFLWNGRAAFALDSDGVLTCGFAKAGDLAARRLLLDTVLWSISLLDGYELLHASAIRHRGVTVAFVGATGAGKTSLAYEFLARGAELVSDDVLALSYRDGHVVGHPSPAVMNVPRSTGIAGSVLGTFADEVWIAVTPSVPGPVDISVVVVLEHGDGANSNLTSHPHGAMALLPHVFGFPGERARLGSQLRIVADLAAHIEVLRLRAPRCLTPARLADLVEAHAGCLRSELAVAL